MARHRMHRNTKGKATFQTNSAIANSEGPAMAGRLGQDLPGNGGNGMLGATGAAPMPGNTGATAPVGMPTDPGELNGPGGGALPGDTSSPTLDKRTHMLGTPGNVGRGTSANLEPGTPGVPGTPVPDALTADTMPPRINGVQAGAEGARSTALGVTAGVATGGTVGTDGPHRESGHSGFDNAKGTISPQLVEQQPAEPTEPARPERTSTGADESQVDREDTIPGVTDMGTDELDRDTPDDEAFDTSTRTAGENGSAYGFDKPDMPNFAEPNASDDLAYWDTSGSNIPGYGSSGDAGLGGARPPLPGRDDDASFEERGRAMQSAPDAGASEAAGGPGYNSAGSYTNETAAWANGGAAGSGGEQAMAGAGPLGGTPGRGDTPDAVAARRQYNIPAPSAAGQNEPALGVQTPGDNVNVDPGSNQGTYTLGSESTPDDPKRLKGGQLASYDNVLGAAGSEGSTSGGGGTLASHAAEQNQRTAPRRTDEGEGEIRYGSSGKMGMGGAAPNYDPHANPDLQGHDANEDELFRPRGSHAPDEAAPEGAPTGSGVAGDASGPDIFSTDSGPISGPADNGIYTAADLDLSQQHGYERTGDTAPDWADPVQTGPARAGAQQDDAYIGATGGLGGGDMLGTATNTTGGSPGYAGTSTAQGYPDLEQAQPDDELLPADAMARNDVSAGPREHLAPNRDNSDMSSTAANPSTLNSDLADPSSPPLGPGNPA